MENKEKQITEEPKDTRHENLSEAELEKVAGGITIVKLIDKASPKLY